MNNKISGILKNVSYTITSNIISLLVSAIVVFVLPKLFGVVEYGYWQLYLFYTSYVGILHFGWNDGIYLILGGEEYQKIDKKLYSSNFYLLVLSQFIIATVIMLTFLSFGGNLERNFILLMTVFCMGITNARLMLIYILQATNRIKEYSIIVVSEKITYILLILTVLIVGYRSYKLIIIADIFGKLLSLFLSIYWCKDIISEKPQINKNVFIDIKNNISIGINLLFSNLASMLIIGVVRFGIERQWDIATFGKISLVLSISNLMMVFINAIGIIIFPILRRSNINKLSNLYEIFRTVLMLLMLAFLIVYFPLKFIMVEWLPSYADSLNYMAILFPICLFEGKMSLLINTFLKTLRKEKVLLNINLISLFLSVICTIISILVVKSLTLTVLVILFVIATRSIISEIYISKVLNLELKKDFFYEIFLCSLFILTTWYLNSLLSFIIFTVFYVIYLNLKKDNIKNSISFIKKYNTVGSSINE